MKLLAVTLSFCGIVLAMAQDTWPQFRGPNGSGVAAEGSRAPLTWSDTENLLWKTALPGRGASTPVVYGERIYLTAYSGFGQNIQNPGEEADLVRHVLCLEQATGQILWNREIRSETPPGTFLKRASLHGYASSTPAVDADGIYAYFGTAGVVALDHQGNIRWQAPTGERTHDWGSGSSVLLHQNRVIVNAYVECIAVIALDKATGAPVWRSRRLTDSWTTPVVVDLPEGRHEIVTGDMGRVYGFDPATGKELWQCKAINWYLVGTPAVKDGVVYFVAGQKYESIAIQAGGKGEVSKTHIRWRAERGSNVSSPVYADGYLYFAHDENGMAYCLDAKTGSLVYEGRLPGTRPDLYASPVIADGKLYYVMRDGVVTVLKAGPEFQILARNVVTSDPEEKFDASPVIVGGKLYLRSDRMLYAVGER